MKKDNHNPKTRYPNLLEEIRLRQFMSGHVANAANITKELLNAVLFEGEKLSDDEMMCAAKQLDRPFFYLINPKLKFFGKSKDDKRIFANFQEKADKLIALRRSAKEKGVRFGYYTNLHYQNVIDFCEAIASRGVTTYGQYRLADDAIEHATSLIYEDIRETDRRSRPQPRGVEKRLVAANEI